jgi:MtaA/CmuA family methyltransferase
MENRAMTGRERILNCLNGRPIDHLPFMPITMMFAADCAGAPYRSYATDYRVLVDAQLRTAETYGFDYVSCISDPAREAADCGAAVHFFDDQPPALDESRARLADRADLVRLAMPDPLGGGRMYDRVCAAASFRERAAKDYLVEGWVEGPCAEAADLRGINALMTDFYEAPDFVNDLFAFVLDLGLQFARAQVDAGVDLIGVGDAAASLVGPDLYETFVWPFEQRLVAGIHAMGALVRLHICGNTRPILENMGRLDCDIVDLDYMVPLDEARAAMGPAQVLLGNLDPVAVVRNGSPDQLREAVAACHRAAGPRYVVGAGCEIVRDTPPDRLFILRDYARTHV